MPRQWGPQHTVMAAAAGLGLGLAGWEALKRLREADLHGQVALITGSSRGLGFLLAREFARVGCRVVICARDDQGLAQAREELERGGATVLAARCDLSDRHQVNDLITEVNFCYGQVDILVNNAGFIEVGPVETMTVEDFERAMGVMFWGMLYPTLAVLPQMRQRRRGRIVNITSIGGKVSLPHLLPYSSAKFAAVGFSEGLRAEVARQGVQVTTIVPGLMRTGGHLNARFKGRQEAEYTWFSLGGSLPGLSMSAERAARLIVRAARRGEAERILSLPANVLARIEGLCPATTSELLALVNQLILPKAAPDETAAGRGQEIQERLHSPLLNALTRLGRTAGEHLQHAGGPGSNGAGQPAKQPAS